MHKTLNLGSCLCGKIQFEVSEIGPVIGHCHCIMCRKFHGAAFSTFAEVKLEHINWIQGQALLNTFKADNETVRTFCKNCGSSLLFESKFNRQDKTIEIALAAFDSLESVTPDAHIYTESKVEWLTLNDDLDQFDTYRKPVR